MITLRTLALAMLSWMAVLTLPPLLPAVPAQVAPYVAESEARLTPVPVGAPPVAYGAVGAALLIGFGIGLAAVVVIRRWERRRPIERETEAHQRERAHARH